MQFLLETLGGGVLLPALVSVVLLIVLRRPRWEWLRPLAAGVAFFAGYAAQSWAPLRPVGAWHWLPWLALLAAAVELLAGKFPVGVGFVLYAAAAGGAGWLLMGAGQPAAVIGFIVGVVVLWAALERMAGRQTDVWLPLILVGVAAADSAVLMLAGSASFAQLGGVAAAALGGVWLAAWWAREPRLAQAAVPCAALLLPALLTAGYGATFSDVPVASFLLVAFSPLLLGIGWLRPVRESKWRPLIQAAAVLVPVLVALVLAALHADLEEV